MFDVKKNYVLGMVFDTELKEVLLVKRNKEPYINTTNGIGGKVEGKESIAEAMEREMLEETDIKLENVNKTEYLATIYYPSGVLLNVFYMILNDSYVKKNKIDTVEGILRWHNIVNDNLLYTAKENMAGEGNVAYFINYALYKEGIDAGYIKGIKLSPPSNQPSPQC